MCPLACLVGLGERHETAAAPRRPSLAAGKPLHSPYSLFGHVHSRTRARTCRALAFDRFARSFDDLSYLALRSANRRSSVPRSFIDLAFVVQRWIVGQIG